MSDFPILWSFRRCPYAMRARLGILKAGLIVEQREILLRDKPPAFLETSPSATVPCLRVGDHVIDESLDIMIWALDQNDPHKLLDMPELGWDLIKTNDGPFKQALDHSKYATRYPDVDPAQERNKAAEHLYKLDGLLEGKDWLFGGDPKLADLALLPFVRQFAHIDLTWFEEQPWPCVIRWLNRFKSSDDFARIMKKHSAWSDGASPLLFGGNPAW